MIRKKMIFWGKTFFIVFLITFLFNLLLRQAKRDVITSVIYLIGACAFALMLPESIHNVKHMQYSSNYFSERKKLLCCILMSLFFFICSFIIYFI